MCMRFEVLEAMTPIASMFSFATRYAKEKPLTKSSPTSHTPLGLPPPCTTPCSSLKLSCRMAKSGSVPVRIEPPGQALDSHSQRCRLPPQLVKQLGVSHGTPVVLCSRASAWLCSAVPAEVASWSKEPPRLPAVQADRSVALPDSWVQEGPDSISVVDSDISPAGTCLVSFEAVQGEAGCVLPVKSSISAASGAVAWATPAPCPMRGAGSVAKSGFDLSAVRAALTGVLLAPGCAVQVHPSSGLDPSTTIVRVHSIGGTTSGRKLYRVGGSTQFGLFQGKSSLARAPTAAVHAAPRTPPLHGLESALEELQMPFMAAAKDPAAALLLQVEAPVGFLLTGSAGSEVDTVPHLLVEQLRAAGLGISAQVFQPAAGEESRSAGVKAAFSAAHEYCKLHCTLEQPGMAVAVVHLPDLDGLASARSGMGVVQGGATTEGSAQSVGQLLVHIDAASRANAESASVRGPAAAASIVIVATAGRAEGVDPALRRPGRLEKEIGLLPMDQACRAGFIQAILGSACPPAASVQALAADLVGYQRRDLRLLCRLALAAACQCSVEDGHDSLQSLAVSVSVANLQRARSIVPPSHIAAFTSAPRRVEWSDIAGYADVKATLQHSIVWPFAHPEAFERLGISPPRGVLLFGPPGCAKTTLVHAAAHSSKAAFFSLSGADIVSAYVGESERTVREVFRLARQAAPAIVFLDEADALVGARGSSGGNSATSGILTTLLTEMDGVEACPGVLVVACTNMPHLLDAALLRPGRLERRVLVGPPDAEARVAVLHLYTRGKGMVLGEDVDLPSIAARTEWYTGAELEGVCREAGMGAVREHLARVSSSPAQRLQVSQAHFEAALRRVRPICRSQLADGRNAMQASMDELQHFASARGAGNKAMLGNAAASS